MKVSETTGGFQYVPDSEPAAPLFHGGHQADIWDSHEQPEGWCGCIARIFTTLGSKIKQLVCKVFCYFCEKSPQTLGEVRKGVKAAYEALSDPEKYKSAFAAFPDELKQGFLFTTMQMIAGGKLLREGVEPPSIESESALQKVAQEVLDRPDHPQFDVKLVFEDYIQKLS